MHDAWHKPIRTIAVLGNHLPRQCGIATFTTDLTSALEAAAPAADCFVVAMNSGTSKPQYPARVRFEVQQDDIDGYRRAAEFLNMQAVDVVSLQHEYGIFGGRAGAHVLELVRGLQMPVVSTLHTVLPNPTPDQRAALDELLALSARVVVMSEDGARLLRTVHGVDASKLDVIPHGIPAMTGRAAPSTLGVKSEGPVILTFGLLSPDKGLEYVIDAMPAVLARHPSATYLVVGATHPHIREAHGEQYREGLQARAAQLGVSDHVVFQNRFVSREELMDILGAADVYVTPYLKEEQSTSGTLAYAVGSGKAVVSTPYRYARELLADGRGVLVPWRDSEALAQELSALLDDPGRRRQLEQRAASLGGDMSWPLVARDYLASFSLAIERAPRREQASASVPLEFPELDLSHVLLMTDETGILQHATWDVPRYSDGYCVDDNARALLLMTLLDEAGAAPPDMTRVLATRYLAFLNLAFDPAQRRFRNFLDYSRVWSEACGSEDSHGRALWALGTVVGRSTDPGRRSLSDGLFRSALPAMLNFTSPRAWAYALLGIDAYLRAFAGDNATELVQRKLAARLVERYHHSKNDGWPWFEDRLTYCNARLPQALMVTAERLGDVAMAKIANESLRWLVKQQTASDGTFAPVGTNGFFVREGERAQYDQQPVEACATVSACLDAHRITRNTRWLTHARVAFQWFLGRNPRRVQVYDARTGGCRDGLHSDRLNQNEGAESTLSFLTALSELHAIARVSAATSSQATLELQ